MIASQNEDEFNLRVTLGSSAVNSALSSVSEGTNSQTIISVTPAKLMSPKREWEEDMDVTVSDNEARKAKRANTGKISQNVNVAEADGSVSLVKAAQVVEFSLASAGMHPNSEGNDHAKGRGQNGTTSVHKMVWLSTIEVSL